MQNPTNTLKPPPHSLNIERTILASMMVDKRVCGYCLEVLIQEYFYSTRHKLIFEAVKESYEIGEVDIILITECLQRKEKLKAVGGEVYLSELLEAKTLYNAEGHCRILIEKAVLREAIEVFGKITHNCFSPNAVINKELDIAELRFYGMRRKLECVGGEEIYNNKIATREYIEKVKHQMENREKTGIPFPVNEMNRIIGRARLGRKYLLSGFKKGGKSRFIRCCISKWLNDGCGVLIIMTEGDKDDVFRCIVANRQKIDTKKIDEGTLSQDEYQRFTKEMKRLAEQPLFIVKKSKASPEFVDRIIERTKATCCRLQVSLCAVLIDTVQKMRMPAESKADMHESIAAELEAINDKHKLAMFWLMQYVAETERGTKTKSSLHAHVRYGAAYIETADVVINFDDRRKSQKEVEAEAKKGYKYVKIYVVQREGRSFGYIEAKSEMQYSSYTDITDSEVSGFEEEATEPEEEKNEKKDEGADFMHGVEAPVNAEGKQMF